MYILASILLCLMAPLLAGFLYQWIGALRDRRRYATRGRWISIGRKCKLYLLEKGSGGPTVIFESGIAATNLNWCHIQDAVSEFTHTVSYDRAGLGWSSRACSPRTPGNIALELHAMLINAGIPPPYVLVGHSFGGLVMRRYAALYPEDVQGVVLVDPMRCEEWPPINASKQASVDRGAQLTGWAIPIARLGLARLAVTSLLCRSGKISRFLAGAAGEGGVHVLGRIKGEVSKMPRAVWPMVAAHWSRPSYFVGMRSHIVAVPASAREMMNAEPIRGIPVVLLTPGKSTPLCPRGIGNIGDTVEQIIALNSEHWVHLDEPDLVIDSIREMVTADAAAAVAAIN